MIEIYIALLKLFIKIKNLTEIIKSLRIKKNKKREKKSYAKALKKAIKLTLIAT